MYDLDLDVFLNFKLVFYKLLCVMICFHISYFYLDWESYKILYYIKVKFVIVTVIHKVANRYNFRYFLTLLQNQIKYT